MRTREPAARPSAGGIPPAGPVHRVRAPVNVHDWLAISFLHWPVDPASLAGLVPAPLEVLTHQGAAWVSVTPFFIRVRPPGLPPVPGLSAFPETNVRTYAAGPDGREGLWFLHMEVTRAWFVTTLRLIGLPYVRRRMAVGAGDGTLTYVSLEVAGGALSHRVMVRPGAPLDPPKGGPTARFLTARWGAYHRRRGTLLYTPVDHPPWPLRTAACDRYTVAPLLGAAGLPTPEGPPLVHCSPGVTVNVGRPEVVATAAR